MLLASYKDVCDMQQRMDNPRPAGKPGYRHLVRSGLWDQGSYDRLEKCLLRLRTHYPRLFRHLAAAHKMSTVMAAHEVTSSRVERATELIDGWMPTNIRVPDELIQNAQILSTPAALTYLKRKQAA